MRFVMRGHSHDIVSIDSFNKIMFLLIAKVGKIIEIYNVAV